MKRVLFAFVLVLVASLPAAAARLFTSGFETNDTTATEWSATAGTFAITTSPVHSGTYSFRVNPTSASGNIRRDFSAAVTSGTIYSRLYVRFGSVSPSVNVDFYTVRSGAAAIDFRVFLLTTGKVRLTNGVTSNNFDSTSTLSATTWYRFEFRHLISDTVGQIEVRLYLGDSTTALETWGDGNFTGGDGSDADTLNTNVQGFLFGMNSTTATLDWNFDDVAVNDTTGTAQTSWPSAGKIALVKPTSNNSVTWTKTGANCSGTTNTDCVDDEPGAPDDVSGYNTSSTANNQDRFNMTGLPAEVTSNAQMILYDVYDRWDGNGTTGTRQGRNDAWDNNGSITNGVTHSRCDVAAGNWSIANTAQHLVLSLSGKTKSQTDSYTVGYEPLNNAECRVTAIWANVEWIEAPSCTPSLTLLGASGCS